MGRHIDGLLMKSDATLSFFVSIGKKLLWVTNVLPAIARAVSKATQDKETEFTKYDDIFGNTKLVQRFLHLTEDRYMLGLMPMLPRQEIPMELLN